jgi:hypothetical protein
MGDLGLPKYFMSKKLVSLGAIIRDDWLIQASIYKDTIMICMFNEVTFNFYVQYVHNEYEANMFIEYVIEKGEL